MTKKTKIRIGNAGGYWGDDPDALARQVRGLWIPTILITADHTDRLLQRALKARVHCVLGKPIDEPLAIKAVNRILEKFY